jgi:peptidoglycan/LPS O-acetylase OafA/YrhL
VYSYSIYLWHYDTGWPGFVWGQRLGEALGLPGPAVWLLYTITWFAASVITGVLIGKVLEVPIMRLRERLFPPTVSGNAAVTGEQLPPDPDVAVRVFAPIGVSEAGFHGSRHSDAGDGADTVVP